MALGDSFTWAFKDPQWLAKMLVQGLIVLIPIIGWMAMLGWLMMAIDNVRAGKTELPPAGFHLGRGAAPFFVLLIYGIVLSIIPGICFGLGGILSGGNQHSAAGAPFFVLGYLVAIAEGLLIRLLYPAIFSSISRSGFSGGLDVQQVWRLSTFNVGNVILAALIIWVASIIGGIGVTLCIIPAIFTIPYENTITAGAVVWLEKESARVPAPTPA